MSTRESKMTENMNAVADAIDAHGAMSLSSLRYRTRLSTSALRDALRALKLRGTVKEIRGTFSFDIEG
jgi:ribosomal protein S25